MYFFQQGLVDTMGEYVTHDFINLLQTISP